MQTDANGLKFYELNQEFRDLQQAYIEKLERTNVSDKDRLRYETPEHFAREIFAENRGRADAIRQDRKTSKTVIHLQDDRKPR